MSAQVRDMTKGSPAKLILLFAACDMYIRYRVDKAKENLDKKNERRESHE